MLASISRRFHRAAAAAPSAATAQPKPLHAPGLLVRALAYIAYISASAAERRLAGKKRKRRIERGGRQSPKEALPLMETLTSSGNGLELVGGIR